MSLLHKAQIQYLAGLLTHRASGFALPIRREANSVQNLHLRSTVAGTAPDSDRIPSSSRYNREPNTVAIIIRWGETAKTIF